MLTRRDYLKYSALAGAACAVPSSILAAIGDGNLIKRAIPKSGEEIPVVGLGSSATFRTVAQSEDITALRGVLQTLIDNGGTVFDTAPGYVIVGPKKIEDTRDLGRVSLTTILARSSNVGITKLAMTLQPEQLWQTMTRFGLGTLTASGFPGESAGLLTHFSHWRPISQATLAYGYGISMTPLQLAQAYATLGSGGRLKPVSLTALDRPGDGEQAVSAETADAVRRMLEEVVRPGGTGTKAAVTGYRVAGKTGTAWKFAAGGYSEDKYVSIFAGLAPATEPRLAAVVVIDEPSGELYYGSDVAAPVFADVMSESLRLLAVPPDALPAREDGTIMQAMSR